MAVDRLVDGALGPVGSAPDEGQIAASQGTGAAVVGELGCQRPVGAVGLGDHHEAGGVLVEAMHDARADHSADPGKAGAAMGDEGVYQGARPVAGGGMHDQAAGLVDHDDLVVFENHVQRDGFALRLGGFRGRHGNDDHVADVDAMTRIADRAAADRHFPCEDQRLEP